MDSTKGSILIIDDDKELCLLLSEYLRPEGFQVEEAHDGEQGIQMALNQKFSLAVLDVMLPGEASGFNVLQCIRARTNTLPVLMLSARGEDVDRIIGLEMGADDYLAKPFHPREVLAHPQHSAVGRNGRESAPADTTARYFVGDLRLECGSRPAGEH
jgi:DNA-binding response OmpR family regulator